jgi:hypothetical protein
MSLPARLDSIGRPSLAKAELRGERSAQQPDWLTTAVADCVHAERGTVKRVAATLGVPVGAVYEVADRYDTKPLKAWWIPAIVRETGSYDVLDAIERHVGRVAFLLPVASPEQTDVVAQTARVATEFGEALGEVASAIADGTITEAEQQRVERQIGDVHQALAALQALIARKAIAA